MSPCRERHAGPLSGAKAEQATKLRSHAREPSDGPQAPLTFALLPLLRLSSTSVAVMQYTTSRAQGCHHKRLDGRTSFFHSFRTHLFPPPPISCSTRLRQLNGHHPVDLDLELSSRSSQALPGQSKDRVLFHEPLCPAWSIAPSCNLIL